MAALLPAAPLNPVFQHVCWATWLLTPTCVVLQALSATVQAAANGFNETGPALDLTNPQVVQDIIYGARAWVSTTSDQSLPSSMANVDARTIYATAYATANMAAATAVAPNATEIEKTSYYTQAMVSTACQLAHPHCTCTAAHACIWKKAMACSQ